MPYRICKSFELESGHMLARHPDRCQFPHGHTRKVEIVVEADTLDERDMVCDYKVLKTALADYLDRFDHAMCMNTDDPRFAEFKAMYGDRIVAFTATDPTTEIMAKTIYEACRERLRAYRVEGPVEYPLRDCVRVSEVRVWETSSTWASYSEV